MPQQRAREALADDGGRAQRHAIALDEAIDAREHEAREGGGQPVLAFSRGTQQLLEEQRIPAGALDALLREPRRGHDQPARERRGIRVRQRGQIQSDERDAGERRAEAAGERIAVDARGEYDDRAHLRARAGELRHVAERHGIRPVQILDRDQQRRRARGRGNEAYEDVARARWRAALSIAA